MRWLHPDHTRARVRLAYGLNLHAAEDLAGTLAGMRAITLPLRARLAGQGERFGVGLYLPAAVARRLASAAGERELAELTALIRENALDPFTFNAFPFGGFHRAGLKAGVFSPSWLEEERIDFTLDVARIAASLAIAAGELEPPAHVSISTHSGAFGAHVRSDEDRIAIAHNLARTVAGLVRLERENGIRVVLALEAEPRASCNDSVSLAGFLGRVSQWGTATLAADLACGEDAAHEFFARHLGTCLDTCHSAVEFEEPERALALSVEHGPLAKLQFSSALRLDAPGGDAAGRAQLLALDEPRYLHQVTGLGTAGRTEVDDLPELREILADDRTRDAGSFAEQRRIGKPAPDLAARVQWLACTQWRCHFHVPVDLDRVAGSRLRTTRAHADHVLASALANPDRWRTDELHLEIETYTWEILPGAARGAGSMIDGLEREYAHVIGELERAGWLRAAAQASRARPRGG